MIIFALRIPYRDSADVPVAVVVEKDLQSAVDFAVKYEKKFNADWKNAEVLWSYSLAESIGPNILGVYFY